MGIGPVKAVFLDRDGVITEAAIRDGRPYPPPGIQTVKLYPEVAAALALLKTAGFLLLVVTNQPDIARGTQSRAIVEAQNAAIAAQLPIDEFFVCWHDDPDNCSCRKPKPGLLLEAAARYPIVLRASFMIGDRWRDIDAGAAAGVRTILIDRHYRERPPAHEPDFRADSLQSAADWILKQD
ncbi:MAG TPA: HAD-IIIA family hydrolase [Bryobacteraceae bacterium]|nr:HAD-IIIA family hydrolase [Bryobacteraceae bacterium]